MSLLIPTLTLILSFLAPPECGVFQLRQRQINKDSVEVTYHLQCQNRNGYDFYLASRFNDTPVTHLEIKDTGPTDKLTKFIIPNSVFDRTYPKIKGLK